MHYAIEYKGIILEDFDATSDEEAVAIADARYTHYDDVINVTDQRQLGGKEKQS